MQLLRSNITEKTEILFSPCFVIFPSQEEEHHDEEEEHEEHADEACGADAASLQEAAVMALLARVSGHCYETNATAELRARYGTADSGNMLLDQQALQQLYADLELEPTKELTILEDHDEDDHEEDHEEEEEHGEDEEHEEPKCSPIASLVTLLGGSSNVNLTTDAQVQDLCLVLA